WHGRDALVRVTLHRFDVFALAADQARRAVAARRVQVPLVVNISITRPEFVVAHRTSLAEPLGARPRNALVIGHDRLADRLTVNRPSRPVIVRLALLGALVDVTKDAKTEVRILIEED